MDNQLSKTNRPPLFFYVIVIGFIALFVHEHLVAQSFSISVLNDSVISKGVHHIAWESKEPRWSGDIVVADWTPSVELKTVKANNALMGYETTQEMMRT